MLLHQCFVDPTLFYSQGLIPQLIFFSIPGLQILPCIKNFFCSSVCCISETKSMNGSHQSKNTGGKNLQVLINKLFLCVITIPLIVFTFKILLLQKQIYASLSWTYLF